MTGPIAAGGQPFTINGQPQMLTEYAAGPETPLLVINTSGQLVWLAAHSGVGPSSGVPLEPDTALPWIGAGQVWAVTDPGATGPATVVISGAIAGWTPSPAQIAAQITQSGLATAIAQQLLLTGVPNVLRQDVLAASLVIAPAATQFFDISKYASFNIVITNATNTFSVDATQSDASGNVTDKLTIANNNYNSGAATTRVNVSGGTLTVFNNSATSIRLWLTGSNRAYTQRVSSASADANGYHQTVVIPGVGTVAFPVSGSQLQGLCYARFALTGTTNKGNFQVVTGAGTMVILDDHELVTDGTNRVCTKLIALPAAYYQLQFGCTTFAAAGSAILDIIPATYN